MMHNSEPIRIALAGPMGSGKTFVAEWLQKRYSHLQLRRIGFGDEVKRLVQELWNPGRKDRTLLVEFATSMREIDSAIWIKRMFAQMDASPNTNWVCDDLRQDNELTALQARGWLLVRILVPNHVRQKRLKSKYPNDYKEHMAYANHKTENDMLNSSPELFSCTIDTSDGGFWCEVLEKAILNHWGVSPSPMLTPPTSPHAKQSSRYKLGSCIHEIGLLSITLCVGLGCCLMIGSFHFQSILDDTDLVYDTFLGC